MRRKAKLLDLIENEKVYSSELKKAMQVSIYKKKRDYLLISAIKPMFFTQIYLYPLKHAAEAGGTKLILPIHDIQGIFQNLEEISRATEKLVAKLEKLAMNWSIFSCVGNYFADPVSITPTTYYTYDNLVTYT